MSARRRPRGFEVACQILPLLIAASVGCASRQPPRLAADPAGYEVRDTAEYDSGIGGGEYGVLLRDGVAIDSVDLFFGVHRLNSGVVAFLPVEPFASDDIPDAMDIGEHVVFDGRRRVRLNAFLPDFNDYFSSPSVLEGILYYWGLRQVGEGEYRIHARRYDALRRRIGSCFLAHAEVATDDRGYFAPPSPAEHGVRFESFAFDFLLAPNFSNVEADGEVRPCRHAR